MIEKKFSKIIKLLDSNQIPLLVFFLSFFIFISFAGTRLFLSDEGIIIDQFYNLINGSLALKIAKISTAQGVFISVGNNLYGIFSYSLLILALPVYYLLKFIDYFIGAHFFLLNLWGLSGGIIIYLIAKNMNLKHAISAGVISYLILIIANWFFFKPIYFPMWGELLSIEFTNILISSLLILIIYISFKNFFSQKVAFFASLFVIFATPISFYAITLKHHNLAVLLTTLTFYFFYKYSERKENKFIYLAYMTAGLCSWVRILDGTVVLTSLLITDLFVFRHRIKYFMTILLIILISLTPLFVYNYLILGNPFSIVENTPLVDKPVKLLTAKDYISLNENPSNNEQIELLNKLGYIWTARIKGEWYEILDYTLFLKLINTFGIFLVSPFLIIALIFIIDRIKSRTDSKTIEKFFGVYIFILFTIYILIYIFLNRNLLMSIISDTPFVLEYRYLLILYVILLYFALRVNKIRELIENRLKTIAILYGIILIINLIYFIAAFPMPFINIYYFEARITSIALIFLLLIYIFIKNKKSFINLLDKMLIFFIGLALAEASTLLLFYYWIASMTYVSPMQNHAIVPIMDNILRWMYQIVL